MIRGVKFVSIPVKDQDRALSFYTEKLGFRISTDQPFDGKQRWIELGISGADTAFVLFTMPGDEARIGTFQPMSLWCDDVFVTADQLKEKGVTLTQEPKKQAWGSNFMFEDSEGNKFNVSSR